MNKLNYFLNKSRKIISIFLCFLILFQNSVLISLAQEETPISEIQNSAEVNNNTDSTSNSGENTIETTSTPTPTSTPTEEPTPEILLELTQSPTSTPTPTPSSEVQTGDSVSLIQTENSVNSNVVDSEVIYHTLNIFLTDEVGDIDLTEVTNNALYKVYQQDQNLDSEVNLKVLAVNNFAYIENNITSEANSGNNQVNSNGESLVETGNAYSAVSVLNNVNTNIIGSKLHLVTINIFGSLNGNIILPEYTSQISSNCCNQTLIASSSAVVNNNVSSNSDSGHNTISSATPGSEIETGQASSSINVLNIVNTNLNNVYFGQLYINTMGEWSGNFLGWMDTPASEEEDLNVSLDTNSQPENENPCHNCSIAPVIENQAIVNNNVSSVASSGNNTINGGGKIKTGNTYSSVSIFNLINTNIINSNGFLGIINIFGRLNGNIGGTSTFKVEEEPEPQNPSTSNNSEDNKKQAGGILAVEHTQNVGAFVYPKDTVTFFAKVKNTGTGKVYETKLYIDLVKDGKNYGTVFFNIGDINPLKSYKITTGLVLSNSVPAGIYTANVYAIGKVGPDDSIVESHSTSTFKVVSLLPKTNISSLIPEVEANQPKGEILGADTQRKWDINDIAIYVIPALFALYVLGKVGRKMTDS